MKYIFVIGLGALGTTYAQYITLHNSNNERLFITASEDRIHYFTRNGMICNGRECHFNYLPAGENTSGITADLAIFCVKNYDLQQAIEDIRPYITRNTILLSVLNGVSSEKIIAEAFPSSHILQAVATGTDAQRNGRQVTYKDMGTLWIGTTDPYRNGAAVNRLMAYFDSINFPYEYCSDITTRMWSKYLFSVGSNQSSACYHATNGEMSDPSGKAYAMAHAAMHEVIDIAQKMEIDLSEQDIQFWDEVVSHLDPSGKSAMLLDVEAGRPTEVEAFAGNVIRLGKKVGVATPVNELFYQKLASNQ